MKKNFLVVAVVLSLYAAFSLATSKQTDVNIYSGCISKFGQKFYYDSLGNTTLISTLSQNYNSGYNNILIFQIDDTTKALKVANLACEQMRDSCGLHSSTLLFYDTSWHTNYDSLFNVSGKRVLTYKCP